MSSDEQTSKATGTIFKRKGRPVGVRVSMPDGSRPLISFTPEIRAEFERMTEAEQEQFAKEVSDQHRARAGVSKATPETVNEYAKRWLESREGKIASLRDNKGHLNEHILEVVGAIAMRDVTPQNIETLVAALDRKVAGRDISAKTARNIWGTCTKLFDDAAHAKPHTGLRCLERDPCADVRGPDDDGVDKQLQFLYPNEFSAFIRCELVPLEWRRNAAIAVYLMPRDGEQRALKWSAIDLEHGIATIQETYDRRTRADREGTKSDRVRLVPIRPELRPLLQSMREESGGKGLVCSMPSERDMARGLRRWLQKAGIDRVALHKTTSVSKNMRWHDLRATGLTWLAVEGASPTMIRDVAGHTQTSMTDKYMRAATILRGGRFGGVFPTLPGNWHTAVTVPGFQELTTRDYSGADGTRTRRELEENAVKQRRTREDAPPSTGTLPSPSVSHDGSEMPGTLDIETMLARALEAATRESRWDIVAQLARELEARRLAATPNVVALADRRAKP